MVIDIKGVCEVDDKNNEIYLQEVKNQIDYTAFSTSWREFKASLTDQEKNMFICPIENIEEKLKSEELFEEFINEELKNKSMRFPDWFCCLIKLIDDRTGIRNE